MDWTEHSSLLLIELYRERPILWDPTTPAYKMTKRKADCWQEIAEQLDVDEVVEVRKKMDSLLASYRRERRRESIEDYESKWFGYQALRFLNEKFQNHAKNTTFKFTNATKPKDQPHHNSNSIKSEPQSPSTSLLSLVGDVAEDLSNENEDSFLLQHEPLKPALAADSAHRATEEHRHARPPKKKLKRYHPQDPTRHGGHSVPLKNLHQATTGREECTAYGDYVGCRLQSFSPYTRAMVKQQFNNIIFDAEMGKFQEGEFQGAHHPAVVHDGYLLDDQTAAAPSSTQTTDSGEDAEVIVGN